MPELVERLVELAVQIQQIPAPTFEERSRAEFVRRLFEQEMLQDVFIDPAHNVYARLPGLAGGSPLLVSAHLDTVFPPTTSLGVTREKERIYGPGIGDNSLGVAALFGLVWMLRAQHAALAHDLWLVANACEEGLGDLRGMRAVLDRFGTNVGAYLVIEATALGQVYHRAVGVRRYRVVARTAGGHSWSDYGQPSAVHELARLVTHITALRMPEHPRTTLNVGLISGGTGVNVLASEAQFELDLRSESLEALNGLATQVEEMTRSSQRDGVAVEMRIIGERPAGEIPAEHPLARLAGTCLSEQGLKARFSSGSTDANIPLSRGIPAVVVGITTGGGAHTVHEYIDIEPIEKGMRQVVRFVETVLGDPQ